MVLTVMPRIGAHCWLIGAGQSSATLWSNFCADAGLANASAAAHPAVASTTVLVIVFKMIEPSRRVRRLVVLNHPAFGGVRL